MATETAGAVVWYVVRGDSRYSPVADPQVTGVDIPVPVLDWAEAHGLSPADPDVYLLVAPADEAEDIAGELAAMTGELPVEDVNKIRAELG